MTSKEPSIQAFEEYALEYDSWYFEHPSIFESEAKAIEALGLSGLGLEVGVGSGVFARRLGVNVGIDPSLSMLLIAKRRGTAVVRAVGEYLPFRDRIFDYVLIVGTLCFLDEPSVAIKEVRRMLKSDGDLIVCEVPENSSWGKFIKEKGEAGHRFYSHAKLYTIVDIYNILEDAGFRVVDVKGTLSFNPREQEKVEEPKSDIEGKSFVCLRAQALERFPS